MYCKNSKFAIKTLTYISDIFKCGKCDVCYSYVDYLVSHMKRVHKEILPLEELSHKKLIFSPAALAKQKELQREGKENLSEIDMNYECKGKFSSNLICLSE